MKFGKIHDISQVDFSLPIPPLCNKLFMAEKGADLEEEASFFLGCPVWADKSFVGKIYPKGSRPQDYLNYYGQNFGCIELNSTYYALPSKETLLGWREKVPGNFKFCPKVPQEVANEKTLGFGGGEVRKFFTRMNEFGPQLGPILLQLGPYFTLDRWKYLVRFIRSFPKHMTLAIEFRHPEWFLPHNLKKLVKHLRSFGVIFVITDVAGRRDVCHMALTSLQSIIRFTGNSLDQTDFERIKAWVKTLADWSRLGLKETFFFIHQPIEGDCVDLAVDFVKNFRLVSNKEILGPVRPREEAQIGLF